MKSFRTVISLSFRRWWYALTHLTLLNTAWMVLQLPVVTAPVATAVFAAILHETAEEGDVNYAALLPALRRLWAPALRWGGVNFLVWGVLTANFLLSAGASGYIWWLLRIVWGTMGLFWGMLNLYFWPLFFDMRHPSVWLTLRRSAVFALTRPGLAWGIFLLTLLLLVFSTFLTFFLVVAWMSWAGLMAEYAVRDELERRHRPVKN